MKTINILDVVFVSICAFITLTLGIGVYVLPHESFSEEENRALASPPQIGLEELASGELFEGLSTFYSDRIPLRGLMIRIKAHCELLLGKKENNAVLFSTDGRLLRREIYSNYATLEKNLLGIERLDKNIGIVSALVPRSIDVYTGGEESRRLCEAVGCAPLLNILRGVGDRAYYKTDHHLDADGVFEVYRYVMRELGKAPLSRDAFELTEMSDGFFGSTYSQGGLISSVSDSISAWRYGGDDALEVKCLDVGCDICSLYASDELRGKDKYRYFLGGNHGTLTVEHTDEVKRERLFIIKDSFANAIIPLLARHFDLTVYDPRYSPSPPEFAFEATRTVIICGIDTLATSKGFIKY